jgi:hypothetical protein
VWLTVLALDAIEPARGSQWTVRKTSSTDAPLVFVACQHAYSKWLEELRKHLGALIHSQRIEFFSDHQIGGGEEWDPALRKKLHHPSCASDSTDRGYAREGCSAICLNADLGLQELKGIKPH